MRNPLFVARAVGLLALTVVSLSWQTAGTAADLKLDDPSPATPSAATLVEQALQSELAGNADQRAALLKHALELDPNYAPARWQSGYVKVDGNWLSLDEAASRAAADPQLAAYRKRRDALIDTADNQREMARWCAKQHLKDEARVHWAKVLEFDPQDAEALAGLNVEFYQGQLLTKSQMIEAKKRAGERMKATRHWQPKLIKWRKAIESGSGKDRGDALAELRKFDDVDGLAALEAALADDRDSKVSRELNRTLIETVGRFPYPEATQILLRRALVPAAQETRASACAELKKRPLYAYVPQLIAALPGSVSTKFHVLVLPDGMVLHEHEVQLEGSESDTTFTLTSTVQPADAASALRATPLALMRDLNDAAVIESQAIATKTRLDFVRQRVQFALEQSTGFSRADDPISWIRQYEVRNGWTPSAETAKPNRIVSVSRAESFSQVPLNERTVLTNHSCFPPGTLIATISGPRPIEQLKVGDRVLSQDVTSGELVFKPVQNTTLRRPTPLLRLEFDSGTATMTPGHPVWVVNGGWKTAQNLREGERVHTLSGSRTLRKVESIPTTEVYNLVVSEFHNYFAGDQQLLVHDNSPLGEVSVSLPGLVARADNR